MNLSAYDIVRTIDYSKPYIDTKLYRLYTKDIKYRKYYMLATRYNTETKDYDRFIILCDDYYDDPQSKSVVEYRPNRVRLGLRAFKNTIDFYSKGNNYINVRITLEEVQDDCVIYKIIF